jgi:hypothetical protein
MPATLAETIAETLSFIDRALTRIENGESAEAEAHDIRAYLVMTLELLDRDPGIEAAADDLHAVVAAFVTGHQRAEHGPERRDRRVLREAFLRLQAKLATGQPSDNARTRGRD